MIINMYIGFFFNMYRNQIVDTTQFIYLFIGGGWIKDEINNVTCELVCFTLFEDRLAVSPFAL